MSAKWERTPGKRLGPSLRPFLRPIAGLPDCLGFQLLAQYEVAAFDMRRSLIAFSPENNRIVLPILGPVGVMRGYVVRHPWDKLRAFCSAMPDTMDGPKADTFMHVYEPSQAFYRAAWALSPDLDAHEEPLLASTSVVLVEDQLSAIKIAQSLHLDSVALLGKAVDGDLSYDRLSELSKFTKGRSLLVAFDPDATEDAFKFARKWAAAFRHVRVVIMDADPKDTTTIELKRLLNVGSD